MLAEDEAMLSGAEAELELGPWAEDFVARVDLESYQDLEAVLRHPDRLFKQDQLCQPHCLNGDPKSKVMYEDSLPVEPSTSGCPTRMDAGAAAPNDILSFTELQPVTQQPDPDCFVDQFWSAAALPPQPPSTNPYAASSFTSNSIMIPTNSIMIPDKSSIPSSDDQPSTSIAPAAETEDPCVSSSWRSPPPPPPIAAPARGSAPAPRDVHLQLADGLTVPVRVLPLAPPDAARGLEVLRFLTVEEPSCSRSGPEAPPAPGAAPDPEPEPESPTTMVEVKMEEEGLPPPRPYCRQDSGTRRTAGYREKRLKNNVSVRKSRAKKAEEMRGMCARVARLEQRAAEQERTIVALRAENKQLRDIINSRKGKQPRR